MSHRPRSWNDDIRWLLGQIAGLSPDDGFGTDPVDIARGIAISKVTHYIRADHSSQDDTSQIVLQMPVGSRTWRLAALALHRTSGSATTHAGSIGQVIGYTIDDPDDRLGLCDIGVDRPIRKVFCEPIPMVADGSSRLYFRPQYNIGADNAGTHQFWFIQDFETAESTP